MKRIVKYGLIQGLVFFIGMTAISYWISGNDLIKSLFVGVLGGMIVGIFNSFLYYKYPVPKNVLDAVSVDLDPEEDIRFQTPATYTTGQEPVSGKLFLTNKRLIFKDHKHEKNILEFSILLQDIKYVDTFKTFKIFEIGLFIRTSSSETHKFIIDKIKRWLILFDKIEIDLQQKQLNK